MKILSNKILEAAKKLLQWAVEIRKGEFRKTLLMSFFFFLVIFAVTIVKPVRNSLFLSEFGISKLPYMYIATALFTGFLVLFDVKLSSFLNRKTFVSITMGFLLVNLVIFWWLVKLPDRWVPAVFYIWINFFNYMLVAHFWTFANEFFNPREGKRLFGFILTVGTLGGIAGGLAADFSVSNFFSTEDVLLVAAFTLLLSIGLVQIIERCTTNKVPVKASMTPATAKKEEVEKSSDGKFYQRHIGFLGLMVVVGIIVSTLIDYQFNFMVAMTYPTKMAKTEFYGQFFALLNIVSLFIQFFLTSKILKRFGIGITLILMPVILSLGSIGFMLFPTILLASFLKISDKTLHYSLVQSARELLFLPIPSHIRVKAKLVIGTFVNRFASAIAACFILFIPLTVEQLGALAIIFSIVWIGTIKVLRNEYIKSIKRLLIRRDVDIDASVIATLDADMVATLIKSLHSKDNQKVSYALSLLELTPAHEIEEHLMPLLKHCDAKIRVQSLRLLFNNGRSEMVKDIMPLFSDDNIEVRSAAIHFVWAYSETPPTERISEFLADSDPSIKGEMLASMLNHTGQLTLEAKDTLFKMINDKTMNGEAQRMEAARVLGIASQEFNLHKYLTLLLRDSSVSVQQVAIESAGKVLHDEFILLLIVKLANSKFRSSVRGALVNYGNRIVPILKRVLIDSEESLRIRKRIPRVLYQIQSKESWATLQENLEIQNTTFRYEIIKSLNNIRKTRPDWRFNQKIVHGVLMEEIENYYWKLNIYHAYGRKEKLLIDVREVDDILYPALKEKLEQGLGRIFRLLALIYSAEDMSNSFYYLTHGNPNEKAHALELLDNLLPNELKVRLLPIIDEVPLSHKILQGRAFFNLRKLSRKEAMAALLHDGDLWLQVCTIYSMTREGISDYQYRIKPYLKSNEPMLQETAERFFQVMKRGKDKSFEKSKIQEYK